MINKIQRLVIRYNLFLENVMVVQIPILYFPFKVRYRVPKEFTSVIIFPRGTETRAFCLQVSQARSASSATLLVHDDAISGSAPGMFRTDCSPSDCIRGWRELFVSLPISLAIECDPTHWRVNDSKGFVFIAEVYNLGLWLFGPAFGQLRCQWHPEEVAWLQGRPKSLNWDRSCGNPDALEFISPMLRMFDRMTLFMQFCHHFRVDKCDCRSFYRRDLLPCGLFDICPVNLRI